MNASHPSEIVRAFLLAVVLLHAHTYGNAQTVSSPPVGLYKIDLAANSDTWVSLPLARLPEFLGRLATVAGSTVTVVGARDWTPDQWVYAAGVQTNSYYLFVRSGSREGSYFPIASSGTDTVTVSPGGATLSGLAAGDEIGIVPYWTLGTIFPAGKGINASPTPGDRATEVMFFEGSGINLSASRTFYYWNNAWRQVGAGGAVKNDEAVLPDGLFIVRHNVATATRLTVRGFVLLTKWVVPLETDNTAKRDNLVAVPRPVSVSLNDSGLIESGAFRPSPTPGNRLDELMTFDNAVVGKNKSPSATYYYWSGAWRRVGAGSLDVGTDQVFLPGKGVIIRKGASPDAAIWVNLPTY